MLRCGLLGETLGHSYSPRIHALLGDYDYQLYEKKPEELEQFLLQGDWNGLNVTIPYKKAVIPFCNHLSELAERTGSVNTLVKRRDGSIYGDNTDAFGFSCMLRKLQMDPAGKKTLILGNGGACASVKAILEQEGADVIVISRKGVDNYENLDRHRDACLLVNTTPVGMYPHNGKRPVDLTQFPDVKGVLDIVYNPARTSLILQAEQLGIPCGSGLHMLVAQAKRSSELFTGNSISSGRIDEIERKLSCEMQNLILIGMPGCGKSHVASVLSQMTGREVLELDDRFAVRYGMTPQDCILKYGEEDFRRRETEVIRSEAICSGKILSTGGGCVTVPENYPLLHQNGIILWIRRDIRKLPVKDRPLSQQNTPEELYRKRAPLYEQFADLIVDNQNSPEDTAAAMLELIRGVQSVWKPSVF